MPFTDRFQLLDLKRDEGARTFEAREIATGRPVFVHLFADASSPLLQKIDHLPSEERVRILDRGEQDGCLYVVTDRLAEYPGLAEWLKARARGLDARGAWQLKSPPASDPPAPFETAIRPVVEPSIAGLPPSLGNSGEQTLKLPAPDEPGEFTRQFAAPVLRTTPKPAPKPAASPLAEPGEFTRQFAPPNLDPPVQRPAPKPAVPPAAEPGEFTRQFTPPVLRPAPAPKDARSPGEFTQLFSTPKPVVRTPPVTPDTSPGEFTQMLQAQRSAAPASLGNQPAKDGEFTRFFESPMEPASHATPLLPPRPSSQQKDAGEFTQIFGKGDAPSAPPPPTPPSPPAHSANATQVFATPREPSPPISMPPAPPKPGEYTQMFAKPAPLTLGQSPAGMQVPHFQGNPPPRRNNSRLPLLLVMGAVLLFIGAIVIYIVLRPHAA